MADPLRIEAQCADPDCEPPKQYSLEIDDPEDFLKDSVAGVVEAVNQLSRGNMHEAADLVERRMQKHHTLNVGSDGKLYCDDHV